MGMSEFHGLIFPAGSAALCGQQYAHSAKHAGNERHVYSQGTKFNRGQGDGTEQEEREREKKKAERLK